MKIQKRLKLNTYFSLGAVILMLISLGWAFWKNYQIEQNEILLHEIEKAAHDRIMLRDDWLLNHENRARDQWYVKTEALRTLLDLKFQNITSIGANDQLENIRNDFAATVSLFSIVLEKNRRQERAAKKNIVLTEAESRIISQLFLKAYSLNDNIGRLHEYYRKAGAEARDRGIILIIVFVIGGIMTMVINSTVTHRILTKHVADLNDGLAVIGSGDLEYQIDVKGDDELADLAKAMNEMVAKLNQSYTSLDNFQQEIYERKRAEERIKALSLHQQTLLGAIPDIIMEVDTNKIYTWANDPGIEFFGKDVIGKAADLYFVREQDTYAVVQPIFKGYEEVIYVESWQKRKDGEERLLAWWCRVLKDTQGNVTGALSSARDITDQKLAEEEIKKLAEELERRVIERTEELTAKTAELERINKVFVDRELRMRELKERIAELEKKT